VALAALPPVPSSPSPSSFRPASFRPVVLAGERVLPLAGPLGALFSGSGLRRGSVVTVEGEPGSGATWLTLQLVAAATAMGEWAAAVDLEGTLGGWAAAEQGVALERFAVVRRVPPARWTTVVAALLDGVSLVLAEYPASSVRVGDARRLIARARERDAVLVIAGPWPAEAAVRVYADGSTWRGLEQGAGRLIDRSLDVRVVGPGAPMQLALVG
jgi:hypothetical protein